MEGQTGRERQKERRMEGEELLNESALNET